MPRNVIKDPHEVIAKFVAKGLADTIVRPPNKQGLFAFSKANRFYVGRLSPKVKNAVKVSNKEYLSKHAVLESFVNVPAHTPEDVAAIMRFCGASDNRVATHLHGEYFVVTKQLHKAVGKGNPPERRWYAARVHKGKVQVESTPLDSRGAAVVRVEKKAKDAPIKSLQNVPSYPLQLYFTG